MWSRDLNKKFNYVLTQKKKIDPIPNIRKHYKLKKQRKQLYLKNENIKSGSKTKILKYLNSVTLL